MRKTLDELRQVHGYASDQEAFDRLMYELSPEGAEDRAMAALAHLDSMD